MDIFFRSEPDRFLASVARRCLSIACLFLACEANGSERAALLAELKKPENVQTFVYADFGPEAFTATTLKESGILGKERSEVKVLVFTGGELETQYLLMLDEGLVDEKNDCRLLWYPQAITLLDGALKEKDLTDEERATIISTRKRLVEKMGKREQVMKRYRSLKKPIKAVALKTGRSREKAFRKHLQEAQLNYLKNKSQK
jgi:hypothetical protein